MADYPKPISSVDDLPKNYDALPRERFWQEYWLQSGTYKFNPYKSGTGAPAGEDSDAGDGARATELKDRSEIFSIDTPPPTVSGNLHIGHVYSYTQTDMNARYRRMSGKHVFYPFGFDDNGLPTERLVEKEHGIRAHEVSREEFIALCQATAAKYEAEFIELWKSLAISCDWEQYYTTIDERSRAISQASFIDLYNKGYIYRKVAPTQWDWVNQTAIAQAEIEDREVPGHFHYIKFQWANAPGAEVEGEFVIGTTRPELIPACVAVMANPESEAYLRDHEGNDLLDRHGNTVLQRDLIGKIAITPLFEVEVPILPSEKADPEKGTGVLMCCTFGDMDDVEHWERFNLPTRVIFEPNGKTYSLLVDRFGAIDDSVRWVGQVFEDGKYPDIAKQQLSGWAPSRVWPQAFETDLGDFGDLKINQARKWMVERLQEKKLLVGLNEISHTVRFAERGDVPVEVLVTPQWYVNLLDHKQQLIEQGRKISWHPQYMQKRYEQWVDGLNSDWCISRQRYNGVPFPVWYDKDRNMILPNTDELPVNPLVDTPRQADRMSALHADTDVMDTWATSSVTPQLNTHFRFDASTPDALARHGQLFPFDMRPQAHDIIRTWAFYTIAKAYFHFGEIPWKDIVISGHAQDASRAKMSKSKGNTVTPAQMVEKYSADGLRYWSGSVKLGTDTIYDETKLGEGRKLINKLFNATKFALRHLLDFNPGRAGAPAGEAPTTEAQDSSTTLANDFPEGSDSNFRTLTGEAPALPEITYPTDVWLISRLNACIERATAAHEAFEFGDAKQAIEDFFWTDLCDNYLEFSKGRLYGEPLAVEAHADGSAESLRLSAQATLYIAFSSVLRMLAPALPHITEECWSWYFAQHSERGSVHLEDWPRPVGAADGPSAYGPERNPANSTPSDGEDEQSISGPAARYPGAADLLISTVSAVRKWKSERGVSIKTPLSSLRIYATGDTAFSEADLASVLGDLLSTCNAQSAQLAEGPVPDGAVTTERNPVAVVCELAEQPA